MVAVQTGLICNAAFYLKDWQQIKYATDETECRVDTQKTCFRHTNITFYPQTISRWPHLVVSQKGTNHSSELTGFTKLGWNVASLEQHVFKWPTTESFSQMKRPKSFIDSSGIRIEQANGPIPIHKRQTEALSFRTLFSASTLRGGWLCAASTLKNFLADFKELP